MTTDNPLPSSQSSQPNPPPASTPPPQSSGSHQSGAPDGAQRPRRKSWDGVDFPAKAIEEADSNEWKEGFEGTFHEVFRVTVEHDAITRDWLRLLLTIQAAVVAATWTVATLSDRIPHYKWLIGLIWVFCVIATVGLLGVIRRLRRWQKWFTIVAQFFQLHAPFNRDKFGGLRLYPTYKDEVLKQEFPKRPGRTYAWILWPCLAFLVIFSLAVAGLLLSPIEVESKQGSTIRFQVGTNELEMKLSVDIKQLTNTNLPSSSRVGTNGNAVTSPPPPTVRRQ